MNALPTGPQQVTDAESRMRYFDDLERWKFDIAYNAFYAHSYEDVVGKYKEAYTEFVAEAHRRGYPACIQIQSTVCAGDRVGIEEAQYNVSNEPEKWGEQGFFASFASDAWKDYLKEITTIFVKQYGFDYVVFEEPMYRVDIPGTQDKFYAEFTAAYPDVKYPTAREETTAYLLVQQMKAQVLVDFYRDLVEHAKSVGAKKVGVMPWFFIPTIENTPEGTLNTSCNIARIARLNGLDFVVSRMQPDNVYAGTMRTGDEMQQSSLLYYAEVLAHAQGKEVVAVTNPTDEHTDYPACPLIPFEFYRDCVLSGLAAVPAGFTRHWYGQNYDKDQKHVEALTDAAPFTSRLGQPKSPVAFVFSYSGTRHAEPYTYETVFQFYWSLVKRLLYKSGLPVLTFHADTLDRDLAEHPEVQVLVFDEHFPTTVEQMMEIRKWWQGTEKRAVVAFASGLGYCADVEKPGLQPSSLSYPGIMELIGLKQEEDNVQFEADAPIQLRDVSRVRRSAFLGDDTAINTDKIANVRRIFGSRANVLYELDIEETKIPVVAEWRDRKTLALFCGFGLSENTAEAAEKAIRYAMREMDCPPLMLDSLSEGVLWNINRNDYVVLANTSDKEGMAVGRPGRANFWDCREQKMLPDGDPHFTVAPKSSQIYRVVGRRSKFLDILGVSYLRNLIDGAGRAEIDILAGRKTTLVLRASPKEIIVDGKSSTVTQEVINDAYHVTLNQCPPGERKISLKW